MFKRLVRNRIVSPRSVSFEVHYVRIHRDIHLSGKRLKTDCKSRTSTSSGNHLSLAHNDNNNNVYMLCCDYQNAFVIVVVSISL